MSFSVDKIDPSLRVRRVTVTDERVTVDLKDGRTMSVPTKWYPRLMHGTHAERAKVEIWDDGLYWPELNADISYRALLLGEKSGESSKSLRRWLGYRARGEQEPILTLPLSPRLAKALRRARYRSSRKLVKSGE